MENVSAVRITWLLHHRGLSMEQRKAVLIRSNYAIEKRGITRCVLNELSFAPWLAMVIAAFFLVCMCVHKTTIFSSYKLSQFVWFPCLSKKVDPEDVIL